VPAPARRLSPLSNVILTPHVGSNTAAANRRMASALQNVAPPARAFAQMTLVNPEVLTKHA
jgi:phosphoglycerate dehydrogenase-like enzyme